MYNSKSLVILILLAFSLFVQVIGPYAPLVLGYKCFNEVEFLPGGQYEVNLNTLLTKISSTEIFGSGLSK